MDTIKQIIKLMWEAPLHRWLIAIPYGILWYFVLIFLITGFSDAQSYIQGIIFERIDHYTTKSEELKLVGLSADRGNPEAIVKLGRAYELGKNVDSNKCRALALYDEAARLGNPYAQIRLARAYRDGRGIVQDFAMSHYWASQALAKTNKKDYVQGLADDAKRNLTADEELKHSNVRPEDMPPIELFDPPPLGEVYLYIGFSSTSCW